MGNVIPYFQLQLLTSSIKTVWDMPEEGDCVSDHVQAVENSCLWLFHLSYLFILSGCAEVGWHPMKERSLPITTVPYLPYLLIAFLPHCIPPARLEHRYQTQVTKAVCWCIPVQWILLDFFPSLQHTNLLNSLGSCSFSARETAVLVQTRLRFLNQSRCLLCYVWFTFKIYMATSVTQRMQPL